MNLEMVDSGITDAAMTVAWILAIFLVLSLFLRMLLGSLRPPRQYKSAIFKATEYLLTSNEQKLFACLREAISEKYCINCQVALLRLIEPNNFSGHRQIGAKHMDFVITDRQTKVLAVIELDDVSHNHPKRRKRDNFVEKALQDNHPLIRFKTQNYYQPERVADRLEKEAGIPNRFKLNKTS